MKIIWLNYYPILLFFLILFSKKENTLLKVLTCYRCGSLNWRLSYMEAFKRAIPQLGPPLTFDLQAVQQPIKPQKQTKLAQDENQLLENIIRALLQLLMVCLFMNSHFLLCWIFMIFQLPMYEKINYLMSLICVKFVVWQGHLYLQSCVLGSKYFLFSIINGWLRFSNWKWC